MRTVTLTLALAAALGLASPAFAAAEKPAGATGLQTTNLQSGKVDQFSSQSAEKKKKAGKKKSTTSRSSWGG